MGIYPEEKFYRSFDKSRHSPSVQIDTSQPLPQKAIYTVSVPGMEQVFVYELIAVLENRTNCFCCTCIDEQYGVADSFCRNHGWWARRPCDIHDMPGEPCEDGQMPISVLEYREMRAKG